MRDSSKTQNTLETQNQTFHPLKQKIKSNPPEFVSVTPYSLYIIIIILIYLELFIEFWR